MEKTKRKWDMLNDGKRKAVIDRIIGFFKDERGEEIGVIAAEGFLDLFLEETALVLYNKGVEDSREFLRERLGSIELDMDALLRK
jgi:uncharacterized protein (DUF2164 family)